jgi:hypothetical protein
MSSLWPQSDPPACRLRLTEAAGGHVGRLRSGGQTTSGNVFWRGDYGTVSQLLAPREG